MSENFFSFAHPAQKRNPFQERLHLKAGFLGRQDTFKQTQPEEDLMIPDLGPKSSIIEKFYQQINEAIANIDQKIQNVSAKKEEDFQTAFRIAMFRIEKDFLALKKKFERQAAIHQHELTEAGVDEIKIQLSFFRDQCIKLSDELKACKKKIKELKREKELLEDELKLQHGTLLKSEKENKTLKLELASAKLGAITERQRSLTPTKLSKSPMKTQRDSLRTGNYENQRLDTLQRSNSKARNCESKYTKKNSETTFLKNKFLDIIPQYVNIQKGVLENLVDELVYFASATIEAKVEELESLRKSMERLKSYYQSNFKLKNGSLLPTELDSLLFAFWDSLNLYKSSPSYQNNLSGMSCLRRGSGNGSFSARLSSNTEDSTQAEISDSLKDKSDINQISVDEKIKAIERMLLNPDLSPVFKKILGGQGLSTQRLSTREYEKENIRERSPINTEPSAERSLIKPPSKGAKLVKRNSNVLENISWKVNNIPVGTMTSDTYFLSESSEQNILSRRDSGQGLNQLPSKPLKLDLGLTMKRENARSQSNLLLNTERPISQNTTRDSSVKIVRKKSVDNLRGGRKYTKAEKFA